VEIFISLFLCPQGSHVVLKVLNFKIGFQDLESVLNIESVLNMLYTSIEKVWKF